MRGKVVVAVAASVSVAGGAWPSSATDAYLADAYLAFEKPSRENGDGRDFAEKEI